MDRPVPSLRRLALLAAAVLCAAAASGCGRQPEARDLVVVSESPRPPRSGPAAQTAPDERRYRPAADGQFDPPSAPEAFNLTVAASRAYLQLTWEVAALFSLVCR